MPKVFGITPSQLARDLIGRGMLHPFEFSEASGGVTEVEALEKINAMIFFVLTTLKGEYYNHPAFGSDLLKLLFEPWTAVSRSMIQVEVAGAIQQWVPQIQLLASDVQLTENDPYEVRVRGIYKIRNTSIQGSFVFPFQLGSSSLS